MLLRRTAVTLAAVGLTLSFGAGPAAAHEGHEEQKKGSPGQNKDLIPLNCQGVGDLTVEVTSANKGRGVGRIVGGEKGVLIPTVAVFELRNDTTGEVIQSETEEFAPGQLKLATTTCTASFFSGTVAEIAEFDPEFAAFLLESNLADEDDVVTGEARVQVLLRGQVAR